RAITMAARCFVGMLFFGRQAVEVGMSLRGSERDRLGPALLTGVEGYCFCFPCAPRFESVCTLIWRGFVSAFFGRKIRNTPSRLCAVTFVVSTVEGSVNLRPKLP